MVFVNNVIESTLMVWFEISFVHFNKKKQIYLVPLILLDSFLITWSTQMFESGLLLTSYLIILDAIVINFLSYNDFQEVFMVCCIEAYFLCFVNGIVLCFNILFPTTIVVLQIASKVLYAFLFYYVTQKSKNTYLNKDLCLILSPILFASQFIITEIYLFYIRFVKHNSIKMAVTLICCEIILLFMLMFINKLFNLSKTNDLHHQLLLEKENMQSEYSLYEKIRIYKHDLVHIYQTLMYYLKQEDYAALKDMLMVKQEELAAIPSLIICSNLLIQNIINDKMRKAYAQGLKLQCEISVEKEIGVRNDDLTILLCNLLDNAIENCQEKGLIKIKIIQINGFLNISIINPTNGSVTLQTNKKDKEMHGLGLKSIDYIVKKYDDNKSIEVDEKLFKISISIFCKSL